MFWNTAQELVNSVNEKQKKLTLALLEKAKDICSTQGVWKQTVPNISDCTTNSFGCLPSYTTGHRVS